MSVKIGVTPFFPPLCTAPPLELHLLSYHTALKFKAISDVSVPYGEATESTGLSCFMFDFNFSKDHAKPTCEYFIKQFK